MRVAVVTGAGRGIGFATARQLSSSGARVVIAERDAELGNAAADQLSEAGTPVVAVPTDVADESQVAALFQRTLELYGRVDILVNNAGIGGVLGPVHNISAREWDSVTAVNLRGVFLCAKYAMPALIGAKNGTIVNVASAFGMVGVRNLPAYTSSKAAVVELTKQMAVDYGSHGIRVNAVAPGYIDNDMGESLARLSEEAALRARDARSSAAGLQPLGRQGSADEVASCVAFLASDAASFITGVSLPVDGGLIASLNDGGR